MKSAKLFMPIFGSFFLLVFLCFGYFLNDYPILLLYAKSFHVIAIICWMAGLFYLPRLYVYHSRVGVNNAASETFKIMESKLYRFIMGPAMTVSWLSGLWMAYYIYDFQGGWLHAKLFFVLLLTFFHVFLGRHLKAFSQDQHKFKEKTWRILNEIPTLLLIFIVFMVIIKPF